MATNGVGLTGSIVHANVSPQAAYSYRSGMGMIHSAEFQVFFDDFDKKVTTNVPTGWEAAIIDTGATAVLSTTAVSGANGALLISDATVSEGVAIYLPRAIQLTPGKRFFMEVRVRTDDVLDNAIQMGLTDLSAVVNPEDLWTAASANVIAFGNLDASNTPRLLSNTTSDPAYTIFGTRPMTVNTWHTLAIAYDGVTLRAFVDGKLSVLWTYAATSVPTGLALAPFIGALNGDGAGAATTHFDYVRFVNER